MKNIIKVLTLVVIILSFVTIVYVQAENTVTNEENETENNNVENNIEENTTIENTIIQEEQKKEEILTGVTVNGKALSNGDEISVDNNETSVTVRGVGESLYNIYVNGKNNQGFTVNLQEGKNTILVRGNSGKEIKVIVNRKEAEQQVKEEKEDIANNTVETKVNNSTETSKELGLSSLLIEGEQLKPEFNTTIYSYTVDISKELNSIKVNAVANMSDAIVTIDGTEDLKDGENIVNIIVSSEKDGETKIYQIIINKVLETSITTSIPHKYIIIGSIGVIVIIVIIIILVIKRKSKKRKNIKIDRDEYKLNDYSNIVEEKNDRDEIIYKEKKKNKKSKGRHS